MTTALLVDVDTGTDDAGALLLAATSPDLELVAATATWGNCSAPQAGANTLAVLRAAGCDVPVHPGLGEPSGPAAWLAPADVVMRADGLGGVGVVPPDGAELDVEPGPEAIVRLARSRPGELTLLAVAPLTTIAAALALEPGLPSLLRDVVVMGGAFDVPGNVTPVAEANVAHDPLAAAAVVEAFGSAGWARPPRMVPLDVTLAAPLHSSELDALAASPLPGAPLLHRVWSAIWETGLLETGRDGVWPAHDLLAAWCLLRPEVCEWTEVPIVVGADGSTRRAPDTGPTWAVALGVDEAAYREGVRSWLAGGSFS